MLIMGKHGYVGKLYGVDFKVDPNCPPNTLYFLNEEYMEFQSIVNVGETFWQRVKRIIHEILTAEWCR